MCKIIKNIFVKTTTLPVTSQKKTFVRIPESGITAQIAIDYSVCSAGTESVSFGLGHTLFKFGGIKNGTCTFQYGTEIEDPRWDGSMSHACVVPVSLEAKTYEVDNMGVAMDSLKTYCSKL